MVESQKPIAIYCSGGIKKGQADDAKLVWDDKVRGELASAVQRKIVWLNPDDRKDDLNDAVTVFGRDHFQVQVSDYCVIDARQRRGIGVGIEMLSAKFFEKPLICIVPPDSHFRRRKLAYLGGEVEDYVHAHLFALADAIVDSFELAGKWISDHLENGGEVKGKSVVLNGIEEYRLRQLPIDTPMLTALDEMSSKPQQ